MTPTTPLDWIAIAFGVVAAALLFALIGQAAAVFASLSRWLDKKAEREQALALLAVQEWQKNDQERARWNQ